MLISGHGQIAFLEIPDDWVKTEEHKDTDAMTCARSLVWYQCPENDDVRIGLFYRGMPLVEDGAREAYRAVLVQPPHELTPAEIDSIAEVLLNCYQSRVYDMHLCTSMDHGGRRIITVEGVYRKSQLRTIEYFIDCDGTGTYVQQVYFQSPANEFQRYEPAGRATLEGVQWMHLPNPHLP